MIAFLDELGNFKQKIVTFQNAIFFYILQQHLDQTYGVFFHHHQELKPRSLSQNVLKFWKCQQIMSKRRAVKFSGVSVVENIVGFVVVVFTEHTQLKLSSAVLLDNNFWQISGILEVLLKLQHMFATIKKQSPHV